MMHREAPRIAFFRPDDERREAAEAVVAGLGGRPVADPMLAITPTGSNPRVDGDYLILTSRTASELLEADRLRSASGLICAIGDATARALREIGLEVDIVPGTATSVGVVEALAGEVDGARVEVARSNAGTDILVDGLVEAGAYVHETVLYTLERPPKSGHSVDQLVAGDLDALLFTSRLTVEHFLESAAEDSRETAVRERFDEVIVGAIGPPTAGALEAHGIHVDVVAREASFETLAQEVFERL